MTGKKLPLMRQSPPSSCCWPLPWTESFNFEDARGGFCFEVSGCWWLVGCVFFNFGVCACVCIVLRLHI